MNREVKISDDEWYGTDLKIIFYHIRRYKMKPIKVFISQVMRGKTENEILCERNIAIDKIKGMFSDRSIVIIDSYFEDYNPKEGSIPLKYLSKSLELLADADVAYFCFGWDTARGCRIEHQCAVEYGIDRIFD